MLYIEMLRVHQGWGVGPGDIVEVDKQTAAKLIASDSARLYDGPLPETPEARQARLEREAEAEVEAFMNRPAPPPAE